MGKGVLSNRPILESTIAMTVDSKSCLSILLCLGAVAGNFPADPIFTGSTLAFCEIMMGEEVRVGSTIRVSVTDWSLNSHEITPISVMVTNIMALTV